MTTALQCVIRKGMTQDILSGIDTIVPADGLAKKLSLGRPLNIKLGFDPTAPDLHLGHAVVLRKMRDFQQAGHNIIVIIGDFTARIGDPTGRNVTRPPLTHDQVVENAATYVAQLSKVLDVSKIQVRFNAEWLGQMKFDDLIKLVSHVTLGQMMQRHDFRTRYEEGKAIAMHELLYPILQGYDSVMIDADVEIGGTDQLFNCMVGKMLQDAMGKKYSQVVVCMPLLRGLDGHEKMSKSKHNYISLTEDAENMFGKTMSIPDDLLPEYIDLATHFSADEKAHLKAELASGQANPVEIKKAVARAIVTTYHSAEVAAEAQDAFARKVQKKSLHDDDFMPRTLADCGLTPAATLLDVCQAVLPDKSRSELRRLAEGGGVKINGEKVGDLTIPLTKAAPLPFNLQIGKRDLFRLTA